MRDLSQWKDKVELSLDGRQLFFLFFGGATLACLLFTLGIMTGRRLEARAIALETPAADDPLAVLDQLGDVEDEELTYHQVLTKDAHTPTKPGDSAAVELDGAAHAKPATAKPAVAAPVSPAKPAAGAPTPASKPAPVLAPRPAVPTVKPVGAPRPAHAAVTADESADAPVGLPKLPELAPHAEVAPAPASRPEPVLLAKLDAKQPEKQPAKEPAKESAKEPTVGAVHFTLQLSAFAAKREADDFMRRVQAAGYRPFVVSSDVPGKGIMYRVRIGDFATKDVALSEKTTVEKKLKVVAYLARL